MPRILPFFPKKAILEDSSIMLPFCILFSSFYRFIQPKKNLFKTDKVYLIILNMDAAETCYMAAAKSTSSLGRLMFLPYSYIQTTLQTLRYITMNILSYGRLYVVYYWNFLHVMKESENDKLTFQETYHQRVFNNKHRIRNVSLPVAPDVKKYFDPPTNLTEYFERMWFRTDYFYDRYIINYPVNFFNGSVNSYVYNPSQTYVQIEKPEYSPRSNSNSIKSSHSFPGIADEIPKIDFVPKPSVISESLKKKRVITTDNKPSISGCPVLSGLFSDSTCNEQEKDKEDISSITDLKSNIVEPKKDTNEITSLSPSDSSTKNNIFYKIKIRRRNSKNDYTNHPTYGRYDLLAQAIKNMIPQPNYLPEQTIGPNMIRFTWHCCACYDKVTGTGGSSGGTMRFAQEFNDLGNTGLTTTKSYLDQVHENFPWVSFADLYSFAGCVAIEAIGGPKIQWRPGRTDCPDAKKVPPMGRLPVATKDYKHIQKVFYDRLGFNAQETVALIGGGHGIGGCHARYSGFNGIWTKSPFKWDNDFFKVLLNENWSLGTVPETGIEQYYNNDKSLMMLNTDIELLRCPEFKNWVEIYAVNDDLFNEHFALAFAKLLELGVIRDEDGIQRVKI